jgi:hypothetical protein
MKENNKRTVFAPQPTSNLPTSLSPNRIISVKLNPDEDVAWVWTISPETRYVSGYNIIKKQPKT